MRWGSLKCFWELNSTRALGVWDGLANSSNKEWRDAPIIYSGIVSPLARICRHCLRGSCRPGEFVHWGHRSSQAVFPTLVFACVRRPDRSALLGYSPGGPDFCGAGLQRIRISTGLLLAKLNLERRISPLEPAEQLWGAVSCPVVYGSALPRRITLSSFASAVGSELFLPDPSLVRRAGHVQARL